RGGVEPPLPCRNQILSLACLPVPPSGQRNNFLRVNENRYKIYNPKGNSIAIEKMFCSIGPLLIFLSFFFVRIAMDMNRVMIIGRSTADLEIKRIESSGTSVVNFSIATNRKFKNKDGNMVEEAEYHRCVAYGNSADILGKYLVKGKKVYIEGRLKTRKWQDAAGNDRYSTEIVIENFIFLDSKGPNGEPVSSESMDDTPF
ncbi:MAG TPA: single-stranded DNA-binding protein, partial [Candidatus Absconditabacterales bacterium]|nr:single-stranded DNA-binding protein [Candidatus Absconditabacterales bacterium]